VGTGRKGDKNGEGWGYPPDRKGCRRGKGWVQNTVLAILAQIYSIIADSNNSAGGKGRVNVVAASGLATTQWFLKREEKKKRGPAPLPHRAIGSPVRGMDR